MEQFGRLDVLVNNAGVMDDMSPVGDIENERIEKVFSVNVYGPMYAMRKAVQVFKEVLEKRELLGRHVLYEEFHVHPRFIT